MRLCFKAMVVASIVVAFWSLRTFFVGIAHNHCSDRYHRMHHRDTVLVSDGSFKLSEKQLSDYPQEIVICYRYTVEEVVDEFEMAEICGNTALNQSLKRGHEDAKRRRGSFA